MVLVTGAYGQLGRCMYEYIINDLGRTDWFFIGRDTIDITNKAQLEKSFKEHDNMFKYVVNCAAYTDVDKAEVDKLKSLKVNYEGLINLVEVCNKYNKTLIHISTDFVFDGQSSVPYEVNSMPNPINNYGIDKWYGENVVKAACNNYFIIRTAWLYSDKGQNLLTNTIESIKHSNNPLYAGIDVLGSPTSAYDLAKFIHTVIQLTQHGDINTNQIFHFVNKGVCSKYDFAKTVSFLIGDTFKTIIDHYPNTPLATRPKRAILSTEQTEIITGVKPNHWMCALLKVLQKMGELDVRHIDYNHYNNF